MLQEIKYDQGKPASQDDEASSFCKLCKGGLGATCAQHLSSAKCSEWREEMIYIISLPSGKSVKMYGRKVKIWTSSLSLSFQNMDSSLTLTENAGKLQNMNKDYIITEPIARDTVLV